MDAARIVEQTAAPAGSSLYYSLLDVPVPQRRLVCALFALRDEALDILRNVSEEQVRQARAAWWQDELARLRGQHPVTQVLKEAQEAAGGVALEGERLQEIFAAVARLGNDPGIDTPQTLVEFCQSVSGNTLRQCARILDQQHARIEHFAENLGTALQLTLHINEIGTDLQHGLLFIPTQELQQHGVDPRQLFAHQHDERIAQLLALQTERAMHYYTQALAALPAQSRYNQRMGIILHDINIALLDEIRKDHYRVTQRQIALTPLRKLWIAWRTRRREIRKEKYRLKTTAS